ncbi:type II toxin-antitoxin system RatA family toxin [Rhodobacteraceae bacterium NNCM2]|nr:type II toxin-antitoxin system RatA family toxin [Coraliihabitans acroporae]
MPTHSEERRMPYSAEQMFALIADVESYPKFLPWCAACRVRKDGRGPDGAGVVEADLVISFKVFRERFGSRVTMDPQALIIDVKYLDGPFRYLDNHWKFIPDGDGCMVDFFVDFEFKSRTLQAIIGVVFGEAMNRIVRAFEARADELYGKG